MSCVVLCGCCAELVVLKMPNLFSGNESAGGAAGPAAGAEDDPEAATRAGAGATATGADEHAVKSGGAQAQQQQQQPIAVGFSSLQSAKIKQFMQQYSIAKALQSKRVAGLVQLRTHRPPRRSHSHGAQRSQAERSERRAWHGHAAWAWPRDRNRNRTHADTGD